MEIFEIPEGVTVWAKCPVEVCKKVSWACCPDHLSDEMRDHLVSSHRHLSTRAVDGLVAFSMTKPEHPRTETS
jgi:hypothetical protein